MKRGSRIVLAGLCCFAASVLSALAEADERAKLLPSALGGVRLYTTPPAFYVGFEMVGWSNVPGTVHICPADGSDCSKFRPQVFTAVTGLGRQKIEIGESSRLLFKTGEYTLKFVSSRDPDHYEPLLNRSEGTKFPIITDETSEHFQPNARLQSETQPNDENAAMALVRIVPVFRKRVTTGATAPERHSDPRVPSEGTGVIINDLGEVVTAAHVVIAPDGERATSIRVEFPLDPNSNAPSSVEYQVDVDVLPPNSNLARSPGFPDDHDVERQLVVLVPKVPLTLNAFSWLEARGREQMGEFKEQVFATQSLHRDLPNTTAFDSPAEGPKALQRAPYSLAPYSPKNEIDYLSAKCDLGEADSGAPLFDNRRVLWGIYVGRRQYRDLHGAPGGDVTFRREFHWAYDIIVHQRELAAAREKLQ